MQRPPGRVAALQGNHGRTYIEPHEDSPLGSRAYGRAAQSTAGTMVLRTIEVRGAARLNCPTPLRGDATP